MAIEAPGCLYLCATPIGNLKDITLRTLEILKEVDIIAAEDTRNTLRLLNHFDIKGNLTSYHEHNKYEKAEYLIGQMMSGKKTALVTDAGTPAISDPGEVLVKRCIEENIPVTSLPGPCALITALTISGLSSKNFVFEGFLPSEKKDREQVLLRLKNETRTVIFYEAPHRIKKTLAVLCEEVGKDRKAALCRELTKLHEEVLRTDLGSALGYFEENEPRGEYVIVLEGRNREDLEQERIKEFMALSVKDHVKLYTDEGSELKEAMKKAAKDRGITKREIYSELLKEEGK